MTIPNRISHSAVDRYIECSLCFRLHYIENIRPVRKKSALLFGAALDKGLNHLLLTKDLDEALDIFKEAWEKVDVETTDFSKSDLDEELVNWTGGIISTNRSKSWHSLHVKGCLFIQQYHKDILPRIKRVIVVQEPISLKNTEGDEITGALDLIVEWEDGKIYLFDNKSSSVKYAPDSAKMGQQLPLYYYIKKDEYKLDGVGYIVMSKKINKNKVKTCKKCNTINKGMHKTCPESYDTPVMNGENIKVVSKKCGGEFDIVINPTVDIEVILNTVDESDEKRVIETFDYVNNCIADGIFSDTHTQERNKFYQYCPYKEYTPENADFIKVEKKE